MSYNSKSVSPVIEFHEVTDTSLKRYWPEGISRIVFEFANKNAKGKNKIEIAEVK